MAGVADVSVAVQAGVSRLIALTSEKLELAVKASVSTVAVPVGPMSTVRFAPLSFL